MTATADGANNSNDRTPTQARRNGPAIKVEISEGALKLLLEKLGQGGDSPPVPPRWSAWHHVGEPLFYAVLAHTLLTLTGGYSLLSRVVA